MLRAVNATLHHISTKLAVFVILLTFVLAGNTLTSEAVSCSEISSISYIKVLCITYLGICDYGPFQ